MRTDRRWRVGVAIVSALVGCVVALAIQVSGPLLLGPALRALRDVDDVLLGRQERSGALPPSPTEGRASEDEAPSTRVVASAPEPTGPAASAGDAGLRVAGRAPSGADRSATDAGGRNTAADPGDGDSRSRRDGNVEDSDPPAAPGEDGGPGGDDEGADDEVGDDEGNGEGDDEGNGQGQGNGNGNAGGNGNGNADGQGQGNGNGGPPDDDEGGDDDDENEDDD